MESGDAVVLGRREGREGGRDKTKGTGETKRVGRGRCGPRRTGASAARGRNADPVPSPSQFHHG